MNRVKESLIVASSLLVIVAMIVGIIWYMQPFVGQRATTRPESTAQVEAVPTLGGAISVKLENPTAGEYPETNPFREDTNPLEGVYKNPFE